MVDNMEKTTTLYLPHELIVQILMWLPVKFLLRFKCVCKLWFSLISDPGFANSHFQLTFATHTPRIMCMSLISHEIRSIDFEAFLNYYDPASIDIKFPLPRSDFPVEVRGSCRGFILLYRRSRIYIWNPSTGFKTQLLSPFNSKLVAPHRIRILGFGYDHSRDDYLVVSLSYDTTVANDVSTHLEFFSFRDNAWKVIEGTHFPYVVVPSQRKGLLFNGDIHWLALRRDLGWNVIVAFDLMERKLFEMPLPRDFDNAIDSSLWVFGEFLSLWAMNYANDTVEIWVMTEYNVHSSWTKTLTLSVYAIPNHYFQPIYSTQNGDIIGKYGSTRLVKYNDKGQLVGNRIFCNSPCEVVMYMESLLSLPGDNEQV